MLLAYSYSHNECFCWDRFELSIICVLLVLSSVSISLQIAGISGCDYVRIHFKALNGNGIYFKDDPYVVLGLYNHQIFEEYKGLGIRPHLKKNRSS